MCGVALGCFLASLSAQTVELDETCTVTILNRSEQVQEGGWFGIANVPVERGLFRVRVYCTQNGETVYGQSDFFEPSTAPSRIAIGEITLGELDPLPVSIAATGPVSFLSVEGETTQLTATATLPDSSTRDVTTRSEGTLWTSSNNRVATVSDDGLVTAVSQGRVILQALNEGVQGAYEIQVLIPNDSDDDGLPDEYEIGNGLDPNNPDDAGQDADSDGLSNLEEFERGTNPRSADSDGDGLIDSEEESLGSDPLLADSDGDRLTDGEELALGTDFSLVDSDGDQVPDGLEIELGLDPTSADVTTSVAGRVVDQNGDPVEGANAVIFESLTTISDVNGEFELNFVPVSQGDLTVTVFNIMSGMVATGSGGPLVAVSGGTTDFGDITLVPNSGVVSGFVRDSNGEVVRDALVSVLAGDFERETRTDALGFYLVAGVTAGAVEVQARDFATGLRGRDGGNLGLNQSTVIDVNLGAFGSVVGTVFERDNTTSVGAGVEVTLGGRVSDLALTDALGRYQFDFVPLGEFSVEASDESGNRGGSMGNLSTTSQVAQNDIGFLGRGIVSGEVLNALANAFDGSTVTLRSQSLFGGVQEEILPVDGNSFNFQDVFVGDFTLTAVSAIDNLAGFASGRIDSDGQTVDVDVAIAAAGSLKGTVFESDGVTPIEGAVVTLAPSGISTVTDVDGLYCFEFVPLGSYTILIANPDDGNIGEGSGLLTEQGQTDFNDVNLIGFGAVEVTVVDGGGEIVAGARVTITSEGSSQTLNTSASGEVLFEEVLAGDFSVTATETVSGLGGSAIASVVVGDSSEITVMLEPAGTIEGQVFLADDVNEAAGFRVQLVGPGFDRSLTSGTDGSFVFAQIPLGGYLSLIHI